jgi:hypothetical protein
MTHRVTRFLSLIQLPPRTAAEQSVTEQQREGGAREEVVAGVWH